MGGSRFISSIDNNNDQENMQGNFCLSLVLVGCAPRATNTDKNP
jgi:hypothetical protein